MRLRLDSPALSQARSLLDRPFKSELPAQEVLASYFAAGETIGAAKDMSKNAGQIVQIVQGRLGIQTGIPSNLLNGFGKILSSAALEQTGTDDGIEIAQKSGQLIMDAALSAAQQIPTVGWAMNIALFFANLAQKYANDNKPYPAPLRYDWETDNYEAEHALEFVGSTASVQDVDWTRLFMPRLTGIWDAFGQGAGAGSGAGPDVWVLRPTDDASGFGCIPPGMFGSWQVQINDFHNGLGRFSKKQSMTSWYVDHVVDSFQYLPSLANIGRTVWYAAGSNDTAAVWNINYEKIASAWQAYFGGGVEFYRFLRKIGKQALDHPGFEHKIEYTPLMQAYSLFDALNHANRVSSKELKSKPNPTNNTIAAYAKLWCELYDQRAYAMCKTAVVAYASRQQPWFQSSPQRMQALEDGRRDLLQHPAVKAIDPKDVVDDHFRGFVRSAGGGTKSPSSFPNWPATSTAPTPQRVPAPQRASTTGGGGGLMLGAAVLAGVGAWAYSRRGRTGGAP